MAFDDIDPATLLQSLVDYVHPDNEEQPSIHEPPVTSEGHFESLLKAVASAGGQEAAQASRGQYESKSPTKQSAVESALAKGSSTPVRNKRKRRKVADEDSADESFGFIVTKKAKAAHRTYVDTPEQLALEEEIWGPQDYDEAGEDELQGKTEYTRITGAEARAAGVQSAAALFRRPSAASKKYTRPPMAKLFTSLEMHPEHFIVLQAAAKKYMLDERHPDRADCVGGRGNTGDTDLTKLKLFSTVESFLQDEGWGEKCFGAKAPGAAERKLKWPQMKQKIVSALTPLLRRMVTNERQRLYALQSRANSKLQPNVPKKKQKSQRRESGAPSPSPSPTLNIDPNLDIRHYDVEGSFSSGGSQEPSAAETRIMNVAVADGQVSNGGEGVPKNYLVNIIKGTHRIKPEVSLSSCPRLSSLVKHVDAIIDDENIKVRNIKVLGLSGLVVMCNEENWKDAIADIMEIEWMNGEVKCVIEVEEI